MKKLLFLLLLFGIHTSNWCVDTYKYTIIDRDDGIEETYTFTRMSNNSWIATETEYNPQTGALKVFDEDTESSEGHCCVKNDVENLERFVSSLKTREEEAYFNYLDEETKKFLSNNDFLTADKEIFIITLVKKDDNECEIRVHKATAEERKMCIKIQALKYAAIKKALSLQQSIESTVE